MKTLSFLVLVLVVSGIPTSLNRDDREVWDERYPPTEGSYRYMVIQQECLGQWREESTYVDCVDARVRESRDRQYFGVTRTRR
jgi:hypothetical protein